MGIVRICIANINGRPIDVAWNPKVTFDDVLMKALLTKNSGRPKTAAW